MRRASLVLLALLVLLSCLPPVHAQITFGSPFGGNGGGVSGFANPTATIGLTAVNGTATTAMQSDAAPALSQAIAPTWTQPHQWTPALNSTTALTVNTWTSTGASATALTVNASTGATNNYAAAFLGGNVGIGTTSPGAKVQVGDGVTSGTAATGHLYVTGTNAITDGLYVDRGAGRPANEYGWLNNQGGATTIGTRGGTAVHGFFRIVSTNDGTTFTERIRIDPAGNVGIGTTNFGTSAVGVLALSTATAPTTSPTGVVQVWDANVDGAATGGWNLRDESGNVFKWGNGKERLPAFLFANIATVLTTNGEIGYCSDCVTNFGCATAAACTCAGGGTGSLARRLNGVNICN